MSSEYPAHKVYLALGSNQGDRLANLHSVITGLPPLARVISESNIYETPPWGFEQQPPFFNQVIEVITHLAPQELLNSLKALEIRLGRQPTFRNGPRLIDIDILLYDNLILRSPGLTIPHPRMDERAFVLVPLADLAPDQRHPISGLTVRQLLSQVDASQTKLVKSSSKIE
jgi:2-amino-4-hydroxy-6-hydroxymethyldihydropteridine diphosphokinase